LGIRSHLARKRQKLPEKKAGRDGRGKKKPTEAKEDKEKDQSDKKKTRKRRIKSSTIVTAKDSETGEIDEDSITVYEGSEEIEKQQSENQVEKYFFQAEFERLPIVSAIRDAIVAALKASNIITAFEVAHIWPFVNELPLSEEKEESLWVAAEALPSPPLRPSTSRVIHITGLINTPEKMAAMITVFKQISYNVSYGPEQSDVTVLDDDTDVGDCVIEETTPDGKTILSAETDASHFVMLES